MTIETNTVGALGKSKFRDLKLETLRGTRWGADGRLVSIERDIDKANDAYRERVIDAETGAEIRNVKERLSAHRNRGSARRKGS